MASNTEPITWNEDNQVKYVGIRPGYTGLNLTAHGIVIGAALIIYTVPANKTLLIFNSYFSADTDAVATNYTYMSLNDDAPAEVHRIHQLVLTGAGNNGSQSLARLVPLIATAGYEIAITSLVGGTRTMGGIEGALVDA